MQVYRVTEEDMEFVPGGKFQVSFSTVPQPLRVGDYLATSCSRAGDVYLSRNAMQVYAPMGDGCISDLLVRSSTHDGSPGGRSDIDSVNASSVELSDAGLRGTSDLEGGICAGATRLAALACRWYLSKERSAERPKADGQSTEVEVAVESWLRAVPVRSRALLVLVDGARYLAHGATRNLLKRLLRTHETLHLLVTVTDPGGVTGPALDESITELPKVVPLRVLDEREAAEVFHSALLKRQQGRLLGHLNVEEAIAKLIQHPAILGCRGSPGLLLQRAERVDDNTRSLDDI